MREITLLTLVEILDRAGVDTLGVLDAQIDVPVISDLPQFQGDVSVWVRPKEKPATTPVPQSGAVVVRAEASSGNTHSLHTWDGPTCFWDERPDGVRLGVLTVPDGATAYLVHTEEHGANAFGPGTYVVHRQREQADEIRMVAD